MTQSTSTQSVTGLELAELEAEDSLVLYGEDLGVYLRLMVIRGRSDFPDCLLVGTYPDSQGQSHKLDTPVRAQILGFVHLSMRDQFTQRFVAGQLHTSAGRVVITFGEGEVLSCPVSHFSVTRRGEVVIHGQQTRM